MLKRRAGLRPFSPKRLAALAEQGIRPWSTLNSTGAGLSRAAGKDAKPTPRLRDTGPDKGTVATVVARDFGRCARCGGPVSGQRGVDYSVHHRRARAMGGTVRPDTNEPQNLLLLCGSATSPDGCHHRVESSRAEAYELGFLVRQAQDPAEVPVLHAVHGRVLLADDGTVSSLSPTTEEVA
ncbi:HNH endonuclease [Verrucosispora sp. NA02020]|uniref:HNH endonuclease n=1 Tax=Verrucosispora sp. NA02020 TaxID=2742132 RepID=UPI0015904E82|nr:HNH endonuclease signature motif containing protein [Verrucosispora sp. NA02020]QKW15327.1 HNH endonuclease [Verrucosispora sp. NA02020]